MILSILTMTEYDPTIWDYLQIPSDLNKEDLIDKICLECAELELLYSDPGLLKYMIRAWSRTENYIWQKLADTLNLEYNPIYNLDVTYEETRTPNLTKKRTPDLTVTRTPNITETRTPNITETETPNTTETRTPNTTETRTPNLTNTETPADSTTDAVAGFNSSSFENARKSTRSGTITTVQTGTETIGTTGTESKQITGTNTNKITGTETNKESGNEIKRETGIDTETETGTETINTRRFGNQGVTMTQDMINKEREVAKFSLYEYITNSFKNRFCLLVY